MNLSTYVASNEEIFYTPTSEYDNNNKLKYDIIDAATKNQTYKAYFDLYPLSIRCEGINYNSKASCIKSAFVDISKNFNSGGRVWFIGHELHKPEQLVIFHSILPIYKLTNKESINEEDFRVFSEIPIKVLSGQIEIKAPNKDIEHFKNEDELIDYFNTLNLLTIQVNKLFQKHK